MGNKAIQDQNIQKRPAIFNYKENYIDCQQLTFDEDVLEVSDLVKKILDNNFSTNISVQITAENIPKCDSIVILLQQKNDQIYEIDRSEVVKSSSNPKYVKYFIIPQRIETEQHIYFEIHKVEAQSQKVPLSDYTQNKQDESQLIGYCDLLVQEISNDSVNKPLMNAAQTKKVGQIFIKGQKYEQTNSKYKFQFGTYDTLGNELFFKLFLMNENRDYIPLYASENLRIQNKNFQEWAPFEIKESHLQDKEQIVKLEVFDGNHQTSAGNLEVMLIQLIQNQDKMLKLKTNGIQTGNIKIMQASLEQKNNFLSYIYEHCKLNFMIAIDFSKGNHDLISERQDEADTKQILQDIYEIIKCLSSEYNVPVYGYGAKLGPNVDIISQCFALNCKIFQPEIFTSESIIEYYEECLKKLQKNGPAILSEIIGQATQYASQKDPNNEQQYQILFIISYGSINDLELTVQQLESASNLPLSIVIIWVGKDLDNDKIQQLPKYEYTRNIISLVCYDYIKMQMINDKPNKSHKHIKRLANNLFENIPNQYIQYMNANDIYPNKERKYLDKITQKRQDYMYKKIEDINGLKHKTIKNFKTPDFLINQKKEFIQKLKNLNQFDENIINEIVENQLYSKDIIHFIDQYNIFKKSLKQNKQQSNKKIPVIPKQMIRYLDQLSPELKGPDAKYFKITKKNYRNYEKIEERFLKYQQTLEFLKDYEFQQTQQQAQIKSAQNFEEYNKIYIYLHEYGQFQDLFLQKSLYDNNFKNYQLKSFLCNICQDKQIDTIFIPCAHSLMCQDCSKKGIDFCKRCGESIQQIGIFQYNQEVSDKL